MNAIVAPKSRGLNWLEGFALTFLMLGFPTFASAALLLATAAGLGLFSIPFIRHACTIAGLWLAVMPLFLPEPYSYMTSIGGLAIFWLAGCADDAITTRPVSWN